MESDMMEKFNLKYDNVNDGLKVCIARMIVRKKINLAKLMSCRGEAHHMHRILKKGSTAETEKYGKREKKIRKEFELGKTWYAGDGIKYDNNNSDWYLEEPVEYYKKRLEEMEKQIMDNKEKKEETIANEKAMTNRLKRSNEQHKREMIQSKEKVVDSILKAKNATNIPKSQKLENKEKSEGTTTKGKRQKKAAVEEPAPEPSVISRYMKKRKATMARSNKRLSELVLDKSSTSEKKQKKS